MCTSSRGSNLESGTLNSSVSSCFQILLVLLCGPEGELEPRAYFIPSKETVFKVCLPFLLFLRGGCVDNLLVEGDSFSSGDSEELSLVPTACVGRYSGSSIGSSSLSLRAASVSSGFLVL